MLGCRGMLHFALAVVHVSKYQGHNEKYGNNLQIVNWIETKVLIKLVTGIERKKNLLIVRVR